MTVTTTANSIRYAGNGTTTAFAFPYIFFAPTDLVVTLHDSTTLIDVTPVPVLNGLDTYDYTIIGTVTAGEYASGATITFNTAPPTGTTVAMLRAVPPIQTVTLIDNTKFPAETVNTEFDYLTVLAQQSSNIAAGALHIPEGELGLNVEAAPVDLRKGKVLAWDDAGNLVHSTKYLIDIENGTGGGGTATTVISPTAPVISAPGQFWFWSEDVAGGGQLYISYQDADSTQWIPASPGTVTSNLMPVYSGSGPPSFVAVKGALYSNITATTATTRVYVNTDGGTTWTHLVAGA